jgi:peptidylprolyl isomerase
VLPVRRLALLTALFACSGLFLTACGGGTSSGDPLADGKTYDRLDAVTVSGDVGSAPEVKWKGVMKAGKVESEALTEGDGEQVEGGDSVLAHVWIGNGFSQQTAFSTYDEKKAEILNVDDLTSSYLADVKGQKVGTRLAITASATEAFGPAGNSALGIANKDTVLVIVDLVSKVAKGPDENGTETPAPDWMPKAKFRDGVIKGFDFTDAPEPTDDLRRVQLIQGTGPRVKKGQTIAVRYLGEAFGGDKPFDENYGDTGTDAPTTFSIGTGAVIKGWDQGLEGVPVGSRVVLEVPPELGYGADGSPDSGIPKDATLVFMIDILAAA